jgi:hypothetical protein
VKAVCNNQQFLNGSLQIEDLKVDRRTQNCQTVCAVIPKLGVVRYRLQPSPYLFHLLLRERLAQSSFQRLQQVSKSDWILLVFWVAAMSWQIERNARGPLINQKSNHLFSRYLVHHKIITQYRNRKSFQSKSEMVFSLTRSLLQRRRFGLCDCLNDPTSDREVSQGYLLHH